MRKHGPKQERGMTAVEVILALGILGMVAAGSMAFFSSSLAILSDTRQTTWLHSQGRQAIASVVEDLEDADPYDPTFAVTDRTVAFREILGVDNDGDRLYGNAIAFEIEGPITGTGGQPTHQLVKTVIDPSEGLVIRRHVVVSDLTSPDDTEAPSTFAFASPYVTVQLVRERRNEGRGGAQERVRLRY